MSLGSQFDYLEEEYEEWLKDERAQKEYFDFLLSLEKRHKEQANEKEKQQ